MRRGLAGSRAEARSAIESGSVTVAGLPATKASSLVDRAEAIALAGEGRRFVSRGGDKLDGALARLDVAVTGRRWLDAGASTGGFTDRLLQGGAAGVIAADVGYGQLDWKLRNDERVVVLERTNVRHLSPGDLPWTPDGATADLSFISLTKVLPALTRVVQAGGDFVLLVKPQFEVGKADIGGGGVVRDVDARRRALRDVVAAARAEGLGLAGATYSDPPGPSGNREFFVHLRAGADGTDDLLDTAIAEAP